MDAYSVGDDQAFVSHSRTRLYTDGRRCLASSRLHRFIKIKKTQVERRQCGSRFVSSRLAACSYDLVPGVAAPNRFSGLRDLRYSGLRVSLPVPLRSSISDLSDRRRPRPERLKVTTRAGYVCLGSGRPAVDKSSLGCESDV